MKYCLPILLFATLLFTQNCKTTNYTPDDYPDDQIIFGSGGGFAGIYTDYCLFENGALFKKGGKDEKFEALKKVSRDKTKQLFDNYKTLNLKAVRQDTPGNMNYYIRFKIDGGDHRINWSDNNPVNKNVKTIYQILNSLVK